jgi:hypothetical protein
VGCPANIANVPFGVWSFWREVTSFHQMKATLSGNHDQTNRNDLIVMASSPSLFAVVKNATNALTQPVQFYRVTSQGTMRDANSWKEAAAISTLMVGIVSPVFGPNSSGCATKPVRRPTLAAASRSLLCAATIMHS